MDIKNLKPHFPCFAVSKQNGEMNFKNFQRRSISIGRTGVSSPYSERLERSIDLIKLADSIYNFEDFPATLVNVTESDDHFAYGVENEIRILNYCTRWGHFDDVCPDFTFKTWPEVAYEDYDSYCDHISHIGESHPETNAICWRGVVGNSPRVRKKLISLHDGVNFDFMDTTHESGNPINSYMSPNYIPIHEQISKYRYLIDVSSYGYSRRVKLFMFSRRLLFIVERRYKEWFWQGMEPWVHYVPVKKDLSDLSQNFEIIKTHPEIEYSIIENSYNFAINNLRMANALERWNYLLNIQPKHVNRFEDLVNDGTVSADCRDDD